MAAQGNTRSPRDQQRQRKHTNLAARAQHQHLWPCSSAATTPTAAAAMQRRMPAVSSQRAPSRPVVRPDVDGKTVACQVLLPVHPQRTAAAGHTLAGDGRTACGTSRHRQPASCKPPHDIEVFTMQAVGLVQAAQLRAGPRPGTACRRRTRLRPARYRAAIRQRQCDTCQRRPTS